MQAPRPVVELMNISKTYMGRQGDITALDGVSLSIDKGEIFGIIGLSGAGKSTLVRCINLLERPSAGRVLVDGHELNSMPPRMLRAERQKIGMIFQQFHLLQQRTALENVCFPLEIGGVPKKKAQAHAIELLQTVGLSDRLHAYPSQLSGGQQQRVAIARALATDPKILLCDEATSALDPTTTRSILALLREINRSLGITMILITHEMAVVEAICHRVGILDQSRIVELGTVQEVFSHPKSSIAKQLVLSEMHKPLTSVNGKRCCRIIFDGSASNEPAMANMILRCKVPVNILFADMQNIDGQAYGHMIVQAPDDEEAIRRMTDYLARHHIQVEEGTLRDWL